MLRLFVILVLIVGVLFLAFVVLSGVQQVLSNPNVIEGLKHLPK